MKKEVLTACSGVVFALAVAQPVQAEEKSYVAKLNEEGKYCAVVEIETVAGTKVDKRKCRTLKGWEVMGYEVSAKEG